MRPLLAAAAALGLVAATPPAWFPGAGLLIAPALAAFYALATSSRRPHLAGYLVGLSHVAAFSWSLHHVIWLGYVAVAVVGAVYYALAVAWTRILGRWVPGPVAFGLAVAGSQALRAAMPEIAYPHAQPVHCLYSWPALLGAVAWGGEPLANALLGAGAAAAVDLWRSWRSGRPAWRGARRRAAAVAVAIALPCAVPPPKAAAVADPGTVRVLAVQPNVPPAFQHGPDARAVLERAFVEPTWRAAGPRAESPPDLVLWPESSYPLALDATGPEPELDGGRWHVPLAPGTRLLAGTEGFFPGGRRTPVAVLVDARGNLVSHYEKLELVAAGEYLPFVSLLPDRWRESLEDAIARRMGDVPGYSPGEARPLAETGSGVPFGVLMCFDNAFPEIARRQVGEGARFLAVLSNEAWYRGGGELAQLEAATVCRALENGTPVVRCTVDGSTLVVEPSGRVAARLPYGTGGGEGPALLSAELRLGPGALPPLSWLHAVAAWMVWLSGLPVAWHLLASWARLLRGRSDPVVEPVTE